MKPVGVTAEKCKSKNRTPKAFRIPQGTKFANLIASHEKLPASRRKID